MSETNKALIMRIFDEALNQGNLDLIDQYFSFEPYEDDPSAPSAWHMDSGQNALDAAKQNLIDLREDFSVESPVAPVDLQFPSLSLDVDTENDLTLLNKLLTDFNSWKSPEDFYVQRFIKAMLK